MPRVHWSLGCIRDSSRMPLATNMCSMHDIMCVCVSSFYSSISGCKVNANRLLNMQSAYKRGCTVTGKFFLTLPVYEQNGDKDQRCTRYTPIATYCVPMKGKKLSTSLIQHKAKAKHRTGLRVRATQAGSL